MKKMIAAGLILAAMMAGCSKTPAQQPSTEPAAVPVEETCIESTSAPTEEIYRIVTEGSGFVDAEDRDPVPSNLNLDSDVSAYVTPGIIMKYYIALDDFTVTEEDVDKPIPAYNKVTGEWEFLEPTDERVAARTGGACQTVAEYRAHVREELEEEAEQNTHESGLNRLMTFLVRDAAFHSIPDEEVEIFNQYALKKRQEEAELFGFALDWWLIQTYDVTVEEFLESNREDAERQVKERLVLLAIAQAEGCTMSDEELDQRLEQDRGSYATLEEFKVDIESEGSLENWRTEYVLEDLKERLFENCEKSFESDTPSIEADPSTEGDSKRVEALVGYTLNVPELPEYDIVYQVMEVTGSVTVIYKKYINGGVYSAMVIKVPGTEEGYFVFSPYNEEKNEEIGGHPVNLKYQDGDLVWATWYMDGFTYSVASEGSELSNEALLELIAQVY